MSNPLQFNDTISQHIKTTYLTPDIVAQRQAILRRLQLVPGTRVLDIGSGPGFLAEEIAAAVGPSGHVSGIDISESMLTLARAHCANLPIAPWVTFQQAEATQLPFADATFDVVVSTQVYEYVSDLTTALAELQRVLRPGGRALILDTDWDSIVWHSTDQARMERVLTAWQEHLVHAFLPRTLSSQLRHAGLVPQQPEVIVIFNPTWDVNTYSYHQLPMIASFVAGRQGVTPEEAHAWAEDLRQLGAAQQYFFSLNRYLFVATKPS